MVDNLRLEHIDAFCVGEPWNSCAVAMGLGRCLVTGYEIWQNGPEKVFGVTEQWHAENPNTHAAVLRALDQAAAWIEDNLGAALQLLDRGHYVEVPLEWLAQPLTGDLRVGLGAEPSAVPSPFMCSTAIWPIFHGARRRNGSCSRCSAGSRYRRIPMLPRWRRVSTAPICIARYSALALAAAGDMKPEGEHELPWLMPGTQGDVVLGPDRFIDGRDFSAVELSLDFGAGCNAVR